MFYLASASPRRQELLTTLDVEFEIIRVEIEEIWNGSESAEEYVRRVALEKARAGSLLAPQASKVLAADTEVILDGSILGKPENTDHARQMLTSLSARTHTVLSAVVLIDETEQIVLSCNQVSFRELGEAEIIHYCDSNEPLDKAGAYGIQGVAANFLKKLEGSYSSVMGLPLSETAGLIQKG
ncbi:MAG: septum formation inhibitor Maf [Gammaproteobacteria bacterium]|nr:septum formation inhibitor Maf [Gammaproteobacteria bacterium]